MATKKPDAMRTVRSFPLVGADGTAMVGLDFGGALVLLIPDNARTLALSLQASAGQAEAMAQTLQRAVAASTDQQPAEVGT